MQKLIQSRLKEIFIVISAIIFKGKATHRFVRKRRKILQQSSAQSSSLHCNDQSSLEGCSKLTARGLSPLRRNKTAGQETWQSQHHGVWKRSRSQGSTRNPRMTPQGVRKGTDQRRLLYPPSGQRHSSEINHTISCYLTCELQLNTCSPRGTQELIRAHETQTLTRVATHSHQQFGDLKKKNPKPAVNHCLQKAPVAASQKNLKHWGRVVSDSRIFSTQAWKNKVSLLKDIIKKNSCYFSSYLSTGCAVNDFQVTIAL